MERPGHRCGRGRRRGCPDRGTGAPGPGALGGRRRAAVLDPDRPAVGDRAGGRAFGKLTFDPAALASRPRASNDCEHQGVAGAVSDE
ncbi:hypothetical protein FRAHR75_2070002 [Frankia sp. Hr75.2]|nr:hypothetical protein FRAHR75_2070002 [Frankia sp. Hr75.2]SQD99519.1 hypothetical protein FMEAI12_5360003 [Parafrankia sp. Ea1.12]